MPDAFVLPEFTRSLRALAVPSEPGTGHDRILAPLIDARAAASRVQTPEAQVAAFDAGRLERAWRDAIAALAAERHRRSAPDRRALQAHVEELGAPVWAALRSVRDAGAAVRTAPVASRREAWDSWVGALRGLFAAADDWWRAAQPVLGDAPRKRRWWRRG
ncbi:MAG TPA: hypothetical protein VFM71_10255 [Gemmatimonadaceae bacterium]|nr:hypothetical protein [Gemmatimonadaceae bacterium]